MRDRVDFNRHRYAPRMKIISSLFALSLINKNYRGRIEDSNFLAFARLAFREQQ